MPTDYLLSNEEIQKLVRKVKQGHNDEAFKKLTDEFSFLFYSVFGKYNKFNIGISNEVLFCDILSTFFIAIIEYDERKEPFFRKYICNSLFQRISNLISKFYRDRRPFLGTKRKYTIRTYYAIIDTFQAESIRLFILDILKKKWDKQLCENVFYNYYFMGDTQNNIAKKLHISQTRVCFLLRDMRNYLKEQLSSKVNKEELCHYMNLNA